MNSSQIRNTFLNYFEKNNHEIVHSSSLVPENDPTLMFANSGMVQFKNIFTGKEKREYSRAATSQKCVRAGGKHNDLENVGYTARHHTFFEMLGNFSFGDYFKDIAIELAWNLITREYGIDKNKLIVTVYKDDEEAFNLWKRIAGLSNDRIIKISSSDNFWSMGDTGPCGPCSEIFYDHGDKFFGGPPGSKDEDGDRFIEIWNLVFMQFEQINKNERKDLPKPSIDTGMGLERVVALLQNTNDNYNTDIFSSLINKSIELSNNDNQINLASHKVIADHLRSSAFLISDGVLPSNEGRGYVLRRIMRRGMRHAHSLGNVEPVFHKIFPTLLNDMKICYPELDRAKELIINTLLNEETKFKQTIDNGLKILEDEIKNTSNNVFDGRIAFKLYDTYGFPLDLTQDYLKEKSIEVDTLSFDDEMQTQKNRARKNWKGIGDIEDNSFWFEVTEDLEVTEFVGYENKNTESIIKKIICSDKNVTSLQIGQKAKIILNQTCFYAESGGQVGDIGTLKNDKFIFNVYDTTKIYGNYYIHWGEVIKGKCNIEDQITASINIKNRDLIRNNHSSTHLLHAALRHFLGKHIAQKGSLVNEQKLRFDFSHNEPLSSENIENINKLVNEIINCKHPIKTQIVDRKKALESGAMALFGEKYGEEVRVVSMGMIAGKVFSIELCGGTHVNNTSDIKKFKIINQSSVASGIRRLEAFTNIEVDNYNKFENKTKSENESRIKLEIKELIDSIKEIAPINEISNIEDIDLENKLKNLKKIHNDLKININVSQNNKNITSEKIGIYNLIFLITNNYPPKEMKTFIDFQKNKNSNKCIVVLVSIKEDKVSIIIGVTSDIVNIFNATHLVKISSSVVGGKGGGGRNDLAQAGGNDPSKAKDIYSALKKEISKLI